MSKRKRTKEERVEDLKARGLNDNLAAFAAEIELPEDRRGRR